VSGSLLFMEKKERVSLLMLSFCVVSVRGFIGINSFDLNPHSPSQFWEKQTQTKFDFQASF
jgi:hypothetical protein